MDFNNSNVSYRVDGTPSITYYIIQIIVLVSGESSTLSTSTRSPTAGTTTLSNDTVTLSTSTTMLSNVNRDKNAHLDDQRISRCEPEERENYLNISCSKYKNSDFTRKFDLTMLYVNDKYKYVACLPQKAGCTTWKLILVNNTNENPLPANFDGRKLHSKGISHHSNIKRLTRYSEKEQARILAEYYKFMVIRHPLDRLVSSYIDKIVVGKYANVQKHVMDLNLRKFGKSEVSLSAFLEYIIEHKASINAHWAPATEICDPCNLKYHKIVKLETHEEDLLDVVPHIGPYNRTNNVHANHQGSGAASNFSRNLPAYANVDENLLSDILALGFDKDMELFGYSMDAKYNLHGLNITCSSDELKCC